MTIIIQDLQMSMDSTSYGVFVQLKFKNDSIENVFIRSSVSWGKLKVGSALFQFVSVHCHWRNKGGKDVVWVRRDLAKETQKRRMSASSTISWSGHWSGGTKFILTIRPTTASNWSCSPCAKAPLGGRGVGKFANDVGLRGTYRRDHGSAECGRQTKFRPISMFHVAIFIQRLQETTNIPSQRVGSLNKGMRPKMFLHRKEHCPNNPHE